MIFLFTDYGLDGPYLGQVETVLHTLASQEKVINLITDAPRNNPRASAYLLASLLDQIPASSILFCVVDPGVGTGMDNPVALNIDGRWFVGPDNGLFDIVCRRSNKFDAMEIIWRPENLSSSFHGRDLYAPICAMLANREFGVGNPVFWQDKHGWPDELNEIIYIDHFGNCMTGVRAQAIEKNRIIKLDGEQIKHAETFGHVKPVQPFWYENSIGLVEIAVNQGSAAEYLDLTIGGKIDLI